MRSFRKLLFPFSLIYGLVTELRNKAYDKGWLKSTGFSIPIIAVGNLSVGGTGKSPMIEYLVRQYLESKVIAVLSRGYGRKTKGYVLADEKANSSRIGDEPYQFFKKFKEISVAVDEDRVKGVNHLLGMNPAPELILLDDAFQHRRIKAGLYVLMTSYDKLYSEDLILPAGDLRESSSGSKRADIVVVSKCPNGLSKQQRSDIIDKLKIRSHQSVFFAGIKYNGEVIRSEGILPVNELTSKKVLLVTGIANPEPIKEFLKNNGVDCRHLEFPDHHNLSEKDLGRIKYELNSLDQENGIIITTEKDYVRSFIDSDLPVYYLPIRMQFLEGEEKFKKLINDYVRKN